jgi:hypothetical protein
MPTQDITPENCDKEEERKEDLSEKYQSYYRKFFDIIRERIRRLASSKREEEFSPGESAFIDVMSQLPCLIDVVRISINRKKYEKSESKIYHMIRYDFANLGKFVINYYGEICLDEIGEHHDILEVFYLIPEFMEKLRTFEIESYCDTDRWDWVSIIPYDILTRFEDYVENFFFSFQMNLEHRILVGYREIDFNAKYCLERDSIRSMSGLLQKDELFCSFVKIDKYGKHEITIEDLQKDVCDIQLIPLVPEEVKRVFHAAKRLYIFGYFDYYFFTISIHYAFLALESALRNRCREKYGNTSKFIGLNEIIKILVKKGIISKGEEPLYDAGRYLRNTLSHLTRPTVLTPDSTTLRRVAYQINQLYDIG